MVLTEEQDCAVQDSIYEVVILQTELAVQSFLMLLDTDV